MHTLADIPTKEQVAHSNRLANKFSERMFEKYEMGAREHGGNLWDNSANWLLDQAIDEAIDQVVYLLTLKEKIDGMKYEMSPPTQVGSVHADAETIHKGA